MVQKSALAHQAEDAGGVVVGGTREVLGGKVMAAAAAEGEQAQRTSQSVADPA
jgi:hypothetical protein